MVTVKELIERLKKEDEDSIVLVDGYEYDMEFLRFKNLGTGKFFLPKGDDLGPYGGTIVENKDGNFGFLKIGRST